ncbi:MAG: hypothetical protein IKX44_06155 [Prevotella sp.]|nr:hypothetical protein [Prevotella sp.]
MDHYNYFVCVRCYTYNHAPYIIDALNGFTMQETSFPFVCAIVDDASTDGEQEVIDHYLQEQFDLNNESIVRHEETSDYVMTFASHNKNPHCFFVVYSLKYNHYSIKKSKHPYLTEWTEKANYIAVCEGDDYWIDPLKLQTQVDIMEKDEQVGLVYGQAVQFFQESQKKGYIIGKYASGIDELVYCNVIPTLTVVYRKELYDGFDDLYDVNWKMGDYPLWLYLSHQASIRFIDKPLAVYRILKNSASHSANYRKQVEFQESAKEIRLFFSKKYHIGSQELIEQGYYLRRFHLAFNNYKREDVVLYYKKLKRVSYKDNIRYLCSRSRNVYRIYKTMSFLLFKFKAYFVRYITFLKQKSSLSYYMNIMEKRC